MASSPRFLASAGFDLQTLAEDEERVLYRGWRLGADGARKPVLIVLPSATPVNIDRLVHEYALRDQLDGAWAARPLELEQDRTLLVLEDPGGEPLDQSLGAPMEVGRFLRLAIGVCTALGQVHAAGLVHKDIKPANILAEPAADAVWLTGFGIASRLPRERQPPGPPEVIAGTLAYMAPEQTGRMNRSIDSRSDLYACGVTFYQMLTGALPFTAADPMEWIHCHIARRPTPLGDRVKAIPAALSGLVMKLLAKTAEERYQTAAGVIADLRRCQAEWETRGSIEPFVLGARDASDRLMIPEALYGREREIGRLLAAFDRVVAGGATELVLVSGYSGIGKSSVVNELHRALVAPRGLFASGKFDLQKRDVPYATLAQAFQNLVRPLLGANEAEFASWRDAIREAVGANGQLVIHLVPEIELVIGAQPPIPDVPPQDAKTRFQTVFRRFLNVFARKEHPLALFLDDLQWLDPATLELVEHLATHPEVRGLLLVGAYRDNEVTPLHPLAQMLDNIRERARVEEIRLAPLARDELGRLVADTLGCDLALADPLARLAHEKTGGNPYFAIQFVATLAEEGLLHFDREAARWRWEIDHVHARGYTDNVVDLMVEKLARLPAHTQAALRQLACFGNVAEISMFSMVLGKSIKEARSDLWDAIRMELIEPSASHFRFAHDRVQEAAYSLIPEGARAAMHLRIGRLLAARAAGKKGEDAVFDIVNQLNRGAAGITSQDERNQLAELNLTAGRRAKATTAYASALAYFTAGAALAAEDWWERRHQLAFDLEWHRAECEFLTGAKDLASQRLAALSSRAANTVEVATVTGLRLDLYTMLDRNDLAIEVCLDYFRRLGEEWSPHPSSDEVQSEYDRIQKNLGDREVEDLAGLALMSDPAHLATLDVLTKVISPAYFTDVDFYSLVICRMINLSIEHGNSDGSCVGYVSLGIISGPRFGDHAIGLRFGQLGYELAANHNLTRYQARTFMTFGNNIIPWARHIRSGRDLLRRAFEVSNETGDLTYAAYSRTHLITHLLAAGDPLEDVQREAENSLAYTRKLGFAPISDDISAQLGLICTLRGLTGKFGSFDRADFDEKRFEQQLASEPVTGEVECWYLIRKLQARFFAGDYAAAVNVASRAQRLLWTSQAQFETAEFHMFSALSHAGIWDVASAGEKGNHLVALQAHHGELAKWAANCPENFENRLALVGAEMARIEGRDLEAMRLYDEAIRSAGANAFVHYEALANELASRFYQSRGFAKIAEVYLRDARKNYLRWGAAGKVRQLDERNPELTEQTLSRGPTGTIVTSLERLDLATIVKVSQAVSGEIVPEKLIDTLMRTAIEHAGATRGVLVLERGTARRIEAEATTSGDTIEVRLSLTDAALPETIVQYVTRAREGVILDDVSSQNPYSADPYIAGRRVRSVLCLPLIKQAKLIGVLYLENDLIPHVFNPTRVAVLELLASQAAISLENMRLYAELEEREAKIRRLVDANIIGIFIWDFAGRIIEANDAFLQMVGYSREELTSGGVRWTDLTPPEWRGQDHDIVQALKTTGTVRPYEKEYFRRDGSRAPLLVGSAAFGGLPDEGVSFVVDLSERKRGEAEARESQRRYREVQLELEHANRVATVGQLSASIAHEVNQPIAAVVTNAHTALRWLDAKRPALDKARAAIGRIVENGNRAGEVIGGIRSLIKKEPPRRDRLEVNETIMEVVALTRGEVLKNQVSVRTRLADGLPSVHGDRVQLQQVLLNLIVNAAEAMTAADGGARELLISTSEAESEGVFVAVADSGPGLGSGSSERLFDAFYTSKPSGLGMGLPICRSIIEAHGGRLWASANLPRGAVFQFTVPARGRDETIAR